VAVRALVGGADGLCELQREVVRARSLFRGREAQRARVDAHRAQDRRTATARYLGSGYVVPDVVRPSEDLPYHMHAARYLRLVNPQVRVALASSSIVKCGG